MTGRERILTFLEGRRVDRIPVMPITMMFASDQIGAPYGKYVTDCRVLAEAQTVIAERFDIDYVSAISDPAREAHDCGSRISFFEDQPPAIQESEVLLKEKGSLDSLAVPDPETGDRMSDRLAAVRLLKEKNFGQRLVEGWIEGPCAEAADLRGINNIMLDFYDDPRFVHTLLEFVVEMETRFAQSQIKAGADMIGIGDAAASLVGPQIYFDFIWPYQKRLVDAIQEAGGLTRLHICGNTGSILRGMGELGCDIVDLDSPVSMREGRESMGEAQVLLGNIDPVRILLNGSPATVQEELRLCWEAAGPRFVVGAGCEVPRGTPERSLRAMVEFARTLDTSARS